MAVMVSGGYSYSQKAKETQVDIELIRSGGGGTFNRFELSANVMTAINAMLAANGDRSLNLTPNVVGAACAIADDDDTQSVAASAWVNPTDTKIHIRLASALTVTNKIVARAKLIFEG